MVASSVSQQPMSVDGFQFRSAGWRLLQVLLLGLGLAMSGCGAKLKASKTKASKSAPEPKVCDGCIDADKEYLQSRDIFSLNIHQTLFENAYYVTLFNSSVGEKGFVLLNRQKTDTINGQTAYSAALLGDDQVKISIFPSDNSLYGGFVYGENKIQLWLDDNDETAALDKESIFMQDFDIFSTAVTGFSTNTQVSNSSSGLFQGWVNPISLPQVSKDGTILTTGAFNMINL